MVGLHNIRFNNFIVQCQPLAVKGGGGGGEIIMPFHPEFCIYEEFKCKNRYIHFNQFEIFAIKAAEKQRNSFNFYFYFSS